MLALGTPGSYGILQTQPQAFVQYVDYAMPLQQAIESPRARLTDGRAVLLESRVDAKVHAELRERGHDLTSGPDWTMKVVACRAWRSIPKPASTPAAAIRGVTATWCRLNHDPSPT